MIVNRCVLDRDLYDSVTGEWRSFSLPGINEVLGERELRDCDVINYSEQFT